MNQLLNDEQKRKCPYCQYQFIGQKILEHEKECQNKQNGEQYSSNRNYERNQMNMQQIQSQNDFKSRQQELLKKCEHCNEDYPSEVYNLHIQNCDAKALFLKYIKTECPSQLISQNTQNDEDEENDRQKIQILTQYLELMEKKGDILEKGEELVKISNFSIEPFTRTFKSKMCRSCNQNFVLDEEILIMKCCSQIYHNICFAELIKKTINCECGKQIIID
ncbi:unnamed protein product [Paramecium primaurelia]|uniref:Uncharacterized protein n=1 Tax=Paramecium primaurelia TaxID=5886 RepID=A0A8S1KE41_PARPR|nr:unnamed protein product [Paramecium primaurelia]